MAYTPYFTGYQPAYYQPPMADQLSQLRQQQYQPMAQQPAAPPQQAAQTGTGIIWVQGEEGAKAYMVAPGASVLLLDSEGSTFYLKSTDAQGMPMPLRIFDYSERTAAKAPQPAPGEQYVTRAEFEALAARLEAATKQMEQNASKKEDAENE